MGAGEQFAKELNKDYRGVRTPALYDANVDEWMMLSRGYVWTGALWVPAKCDADGNQIAVGAAAHDAAASGNPVQVGGVYRLADPALADGDAGSIRLNAKGEPIVQLSGRNAKLLKTTTTTELIANEGIFVGETVGFTATYVPLGVSQYKDKIIQIKNNHDVAIRVAVYWAHPVSAGTTSIITIWDTSTPTVAAGANFRMFPEALPSGSNASSRNASKDLQMPITGLGIFLSRTSAPASGNVVIDVFGGVL